MARYIFLLPQVPIPYIIEATIQFLIKERTKEMMKKIMAVMTALALVFALTACGGSDDSPSGTVKAFLEGVKAQDTAAVTAAYAGDDYEPFTTEGMEESEAEMMAPLVEKILDFDYDLGKEEINGEKATVEVTIKTYPIGDTLKAWMTDYISKAMEVYEEGKTSEEELEKLAADMLKEKIEAMTEKTNENTATLSLTQKDGKWLVDPVDDNEEFTNAMGGGVSEVLGDE